VRRWLFEPCTIRNVRAKYNSEGGGIVISDSHSACTAYPCLGWRSGLQIIGNDISGTDSNGIRSNARDKVIIESNKIADYGRAGVHEEAIFIFNPFGTADESGVRKKYDRCAIKTETPAHAQHGTGEF
jgi:hypothetical protein